MNRSIGSIFVFLVLIASGCSKHDNPIVEQHPGEWNAVYQGLGEVRFNAMHFPDATHGWAVGTTGKIVYTTDGGATWKQQISGTMEDLRCVFFTDSLNGWAGGANNTIGVTTNGGRSWTWQQSSGTSGTHLSLSFISAQMGWVASNSSLISHTNNGGVSWSPSSFVSKWAITSVRFIDASEGWAVSTNCEVLHTTDGGRNWSSRSLSGLDYGTGVTPIFDDIFVSDRTHIWVATNVMASSIAYPAASIVASADGGQTWTCHPTPERGGINAIYFVNENEGWAACAGGILVTADGGRSWNYQLLDKDGDWFVDIYFSDRAHGCALTSKGKIYQYLEQVW